MKLKVNGRDLVTSSPGAMPLLWLLREELQLTGTKYGCGVGASGACTVHVDGTAVRSCIMPSVSAQGREVLTIEGLKSPTGGPHALQTAWHKAQVPQCGYCQSGMLMAAAGLLAEHPQPTDGQIDSAITNLCRCGTYPRVRSAIHAAAAALKSAGEQA